MKEVCIALALFFAMINTGYSLQCYKCEPSGQGSFTPAQCEAGQTKETCSSGQTKCGSLRTKITTGNVSVEVQLKKCLTVAECDQANLQCTQIKASGGECESSCCDTDLCNGGSGSGGSSTLKCYHCEGESGKSYSTKQCNSDQKEKTCPSGKTKCGKSYQKVGSLERESRDCLSDVECSFLKGVCDAANKADTGECEYACCETNLCNSAPDVGLHFLLILAIMFAFIRM